MSVAGAGCWRNGQSLASLDNFDGSEETVLRNENDEHEGVDVEHNNSDPGSSAVDDNFGSVLAEFENDVCNLALRFAKERHAVEAKTSLSCSVPPVTAVGRQQQRLEELHGTEVGARKVEQTFAGSSAASTKTSGGSIYRYSHRQGSQVKHLSVNNQKTGSKKNESISSVDTSSLQEVALNVWATLGFFSLPPSEIEQLGQEQPRSQDWSSQCGDTGGLSSLLVEGNHEDEEGIFFVVSSLEMYYVRELSSSTGVLSGGLRGEEYAGGRENMEEGRALQQPPPPPPQRRQMSDDTLRDVLWRVLFNAVFYCVAALDTSGGFTFKDLECISGCSVDDCRGSAHEASPSSPASSFCCAFKSADDEDCEGEENTHFKRAFAKLQWCTEKTSNKGTERKHLRRDCRDSSRRLTFASLRESSTQNDVEEAMGERQQRSPFPHTHLLQPFSLSAGTAASSWSRSVELVRRLGSCDSSFCGESGSPLPITMWYFVIRVMAWMGYPRDVFYTQTPMRGSIHELLLALLWVTKECRLVAVAEYVRLQTMYPFLLEQGSVIPGSEQRNKASDTGCHGVEGACVSARATERISFAGEALLRSFPASIPWPPASFVEKETIAHRLEQLRRIFPESLNKEGSPEIRLPDITRSLLSVERLITLAMNRLESILHQRAEQAASLGLHSSLDIQLCHPLHHYAYSRLCSALNYLCGMEARVRETTQHLSRLGLLVARAIRREMASRQQWEQNMLVKKAIEEDDLIFLRHQKECEHKQNQKQDCNYNLGDDDSRRYVQKDLREVLLCFRATRTKEQLADLWGSIRRIVQASTGASEGVAQSAALQAQLGEQVSRNMFLRYSLDAALNAEFLAGQLCGFGGAQGEVDNSDDGFAGSVTIDQDEEKKKRKGFQLCNFRNDGKCSSFHNKKMKQLFVNFDLLLRNISSYSPQATAVGRPAANATTSACLEIERLEGVLHALRAREANINRQAEELQMRKDALQLIDKYNLRVVYRNRS